MNSHDAINLLLDTFPFALFISTCGYISRDLYNIRDQSNNFYMIGSMGLAAPIALGISCVTPERKIVVLDGDGSFIMNLGATTMITFLKPKNLFHAILDNRMYESTGGQKTIPIDNPCQVAMMLGYKSAFSISTVEQFRTIPLNAGPILLHFQVSRREDPIGRRIHWSPQEIARRFTDHILNNYEE